MINSISLRICDLESLNSISLANPFLHLQGGESDWLNYEGGCPSEELSALGSCLLAAKVSERRDFFNKASDEEIMRRKMRRNKAKQYNQESGRQNPDR